MQLLGLDPLENAPLLAQLGDLRIILLCLILEGFSLHIKVGQRLPTHVGWSNLTPDLGVVPRGVDRNNDTLLRCGGYVHRVSLGVDRCDNGSNRLPHGLEQVVQVVLVKIKQVFRIVDPLLLPL